MRARGLERLIGTAVRTASRLTVVAARRRSTFAAACEPTTFDIASIRTEIVAEHANHSGNTIPYDEPSESWLWLDKELSSNMAGETGAVYIYAGAQAALQLRGDAAEATLAFVEEHRATELTHLELLEQLIPPHKHTRLLPAWRAAGFALGFAPALLSDRALFLTVEAVETFVEEHYGDQVAPLRASGRCPKLLELLEHCCADEVHHKEDAGARAGDAPGVVGRSWMAVVRIGSAVAAEIARRV